MDSYIWIMIRHPSRAAYNSGLGVFCDLAIIYNRAFFLQKTLHLLQTDEPTYGLMFCIRK